MELVHWFVDFFLHLDKHLAEVKAAGGELPKTSQPTPADFQATYHAIAQKLPDIPRWIEVRDLLAADECEVIGLQETPDLSFILSETSRISKTKRAPWRLAASHPASTVTNGGDVAMTTS